MANVLTSFSCPLHTFGTCNYQPGCVIVHTQDLRLSYIIHTIQFHKFLYMDMGHLGEIRAKCPGR